MRKIKLGWLLLIVVLFSGCGNSRDVKNEGEILEDLENIHFVSQYIDQTYTWEKDLLDTLSGDFYHISNISIVGRETEEKETDIVTIEVEAKSDIGSYRGTYKLKYQYDRKEGYILKTIENISTSNLYYDLVPPDDSFALDFYRSHIDEFYWGDDPILINASIKKVDGPSPIKGVDTVYYAEFSYSYRNEDEHCTIYDTALYEILFMRTHWEMGSFLGTMSSFLGTDDVTHRCVYDTISGVYLSGLTILNAYESGGIQYYDSYPYITDIQYGGPFVVTYGFDHIEQHVKVTDHYLDMDDIYAEKIADSSGPISQAEAFDYLLSLYTSNQLNADFAYDGNINEFIDRLGVFVSSETDGYKTVVTIRIKTALDD